MSEIPPFDALILAAGDSTRMGCQKALLDVNGETAISRLVRILQGLRVQELRVLISPALREALEGSAIASLDALRVVPEALRAKGPIGSIEHGLVELPSQDDGKSPRGLLLWPVDHPFVRAESLRALCTQSKKIRIPVHQGRRGHPIFLGPSYPAKLLQALRSEPSTARPESLRSFLEAQAPALESVPIADPAIHWNCDDPAGFERALEAFRDPPDSVQ